MIPTLILQETCRNLTRQSRLLLHPGSAAGGNGQHCENILRWHYVVKNWVNDFCCYSL